MQEAFAYCAQAVRAGDKDRFLAGLFAAAERRPFLHALYAFDLEIARIGARVREPLAGEIRLQWWREVLDGKREEEASASPVAAALRETLAQARLPREPLDLLLDARAADLNAEPVLSIEEFERHAQSTTGAIIRLAARVLGAEDAQVDTAVRHAALATSFTGILRHLPAHAARGQIYIPAAVLARHGADPHDILAATMTAGVKWALSEMRDYARGHVETALASARQLPANTRPAFLHIAAMPLVLQCMERADYNPFTTAVEAPQWRRQWAIWRASRAR